MVNLGKYLRMLRAKNHHLIRDVAEYMEADPAIISKIERGLRYPNREQVQKFARYYHIDPNILIKLWLGDKVIREINDEEMGLQALQIAEQVVKYGKAATFTPLDLIIQLKKYFKKDHRISKAWLFGSYAREEGLPDSDIDILIRFAGNNRYSLYDLIEIQYNLQKISNKKVDIVEEGSLKPYAKESVNNDQILIYDCETE